LYGTDTEDWVGQRITIFATTTEFGGKTMDCIRVRPHRPEGHQAAAPRSDQRRDRPDGNGKARPVQGQTGTSKAERDTAEVSAVTAKYLIGEYALIDGSPGFGEGKMAELKTARGRAWPTLFEADREAVGAAALAAKARIDAAAAAAAAAGTPSAGTTAPVATDQTSDAAAADDSDLDDD